MLCNKRIPQRGEVVKIRGVEYVIAEYNHGCQNSTAVFAERKGYEETGFVHDVLTPVPEELESTQPA